LQSKPRRSLRSLDEGEQRVHRCLEGRERHAEPPFGVAAARGREELVERLAGLAIELRLLVAGLELGFGELLVRLAVEAADLLRRLPALLVRRRRRIGKGRIDDGLAGGDGRARARRLVLGCQAPDGPVDVGDVVEGAVGTDDDVDRPARRGHDRLGLPGEGRVPGVEPDGIDGPEVGGIAEVAEDVVVGTTPQSRRFRCLLVGAAPHRVVSDAAPMR